MQLTAREIAGRVGGTLVGDPDLLVTGLNSLEHAGANDLSFMRDSRFAARLEESRAGAAFVPEGYVANGKTCIQVAQPDAAFAVLLAIREQEIRIHPKGIHPQAEIAPSARLGKGCAVDAFARVAEDAVLGDGVILYSGVYIGRGVNIGPQTIVYPNACIREYVTVGGGCIIHANVSIGSDGFGFVALPDGRRHKIPQVGTVEIGDDVEIGANTAVDRATVGVTRIGKGTKIDNLVQIGHNVTIGEHCTISGACALAGSASIGNRVTMGGQSGMAGHIHIGDDCIIGGGSGVTGSLAPGSIVQGTPAIDQKLNQRVWLSFKRLPEVLKRLRQIEQRLDRMEKP
jgi:UDP-3-O-[3-hydroxymyristoyl] glucosamine N-acyltransferase